MKKVSYSFILIALLCIGLLIKMIPAYADSGWDGSYGGGGSSWGGGSGSSSWDSGSSSWGSSSGSSYSGGSVDDPVSLTILVLTIVGVVLICGFAASKTKSISSMGHLKTCTPYDVEKIKQILPNFDKSVFRMQTLDIYKRIQVAWMDFDYETLRKYTTDELYNLYHSQLVALQMKKQKNVMKDFELKAFEIVGMEKVENTVALKVRMTVECMDYVVDKGNKVVRGTDRQKMVYDYEMIFVKGMDTKKNKCPNCNAPLESANRSVCPYCDSVIISENYDWVLAKKQMINQFRK